MSDESSLKIPIRNGSREEENLADSGLPVEETDSNTDTGESEVKRDDNVKKEMNSSYCDAGPKEKIDWHNCYLRAMAELDNATKTIPKRISEGIGRFKRTHFTELLELLDGFDRASKHIDEAEEQWKTGFESLRRMFADIFEKAGISRISTAGSFDPAWHEVIGTAPHPEKKDGLILEEMRSGWKLDGKLLRAAQVLVVKNDK